MTNKHTALRHHLALAALFLTLFSTIGCGEHQSLAETKKLILGTWVMDDGSESTYLPDMTMTHRSVNEDVKLSWTGTWSLTEDYMTYTILSTEVTGVKPGHIIREKNYLAQYLDRPQIWKLEFRSPDQMILKEPKDFQYIYNRKK